MRSMVAGALLGSGAASSPAWRANSWLMSDFRLLALMCGGAAAFSGYAALWGVRRRARRPTGRLRFPFQALAVLLIVLGSAAGVCGAGMLVLPYVANRTSRTFRVAPGVQYSSFHRDLPRPHYVHMLSVDLDTRGLSFVLTKRKSSGQHPFRAQVTSEFLRQHDCVAAINASFFEPFYSDTPFDFYPKVGDPVSTVGRYGTMGSAAPLGRRWGAPVYLTDGHAQFGGVPPKGAHVIEGRRFLIRRGVRVSVPETKPNARTVLALSGREMLWLVVDGKVPGLAEGLSYRELGQLLLNLGVEEAVELDGGGSSTMVLRDNHGAAKVANLPAHTRVPYRERPVATHLGLRWDASAAR